MKEQEAINYLETLEKGQYITINIPILGDENIPVTAMYMGKDNNNRWLHSVVFLNSSTTTSICLSSHHSKHL